MNSCMFIYAAIPHFRNLTRLIISMGPYLIFVVSKLLCSYRHLALLWIKNKSIL